MKSINAINITKSREKNTPTNSFYPFPYSSKVLFVILLSETILHSSRLKFFHLFHVDQYSGQQPF